MKPSLFFVLLLAGLTVFLTACPGESNPTPKTFQLTVDLAGDGEGLVTSSPAGIDCGGDCQATFEEGATVTLTAQEGEGSSFAGFDGCTAQGNTCEVTMDAAKTVTATFEPETSAGGFVLNINIAGNGFGTVTSDVGDIDCMTGDEDCSASFEEATTVVLTAAPTDANSQFTGFVGCTVDANDPAKCSVEVDDADASTEVTATFEPAGVEQVALTVTKAGVGEGTVSSTPVGIDCGDTCSANFSQDTDVVLEAIPADTNSEFGSFSNNCTVDDPDNAPNVCTVSMDAAKTVTATFNEAGDPSKVTLTIDAKGNGSDQAVFLVETAATGAQPYQGPTQYDPGTAVDIEVRLGTSATTNFLGWAGACSGTPSNENCDLTLGADTTVTAIFSDGSEPTANGTIAATSDDAEEYLDTNPNNASVTEGDVVTSSGDLDIVYDTTAQVGILSGMRFTGIDLPANATVLYSYIQFRADAASPVDGSDTPDNPDDDLPPLVAVISGEKANSSATFFSAIRNLSGRTDTDATVEWSPPRWSQGSTDPATKQTPDITSIVEEIASRPGWDGADGVGGTMTFFIEPPKNEAGEYVPNVQNYRQADALDENGAGTPARLVIIYETP